MKPPFSYYGGKTMLAPTIVGYLPAHRHYVEPFAGSLAVLLAKPRSPMETVNDLDGDLMNFWRQLRDNPEALARVCALTPHGRAEHDAAYDLGVDDDLERARRVWVLLSQGRAGTMRRTGWRFYRDPAGSNASMPRYLSGYVERMEQAAQRLAGVSLEACDALDVVRDYGQHADVLIYADPPYAGARARNYRHEMASDEQHRALAAALRECVGPVVLSGYPTDLYRDLYDGWHTYEMAAWTGNGLRNGATKTDGNRTEVLWSNRPLGSQPSLLSPEEVA